MVPLGVAVSNLFNRGFCSGFPIRSYAYTVIPSGYYEKDIPSGTIFRLPNVEFTLASLHMVGPLLRGPSDLYCGVTLG